MTTYVVTGAGGSIGSQLCEDLLGEVDKLILVSLTESGLYNVERKLRALKRDTEIVGVLGSVCDEGLMREVCEGADVVIHAAAHKHVPICEANPITAIENNVRGTLTLANAAEEAGVGQFLFVSSDKAVRPTSVMGCTKRVSELIIASKADSRTIFTTVRFGNVLNSAGSVMPLWREQIARGGPITLTDERCERYFMSIPDACELILGALAMKRPGTFVFDMGKPRKLVDIAQNMIVSSGMECDIQYIGLRPGEKLTEELHFGGEVEKTNHPKILFVREKGRPTSMVGLQDLLSAAACRNKTMAVECLRGMVC